MLSVRIEDIVPENVLVSVANNNNRETSCANFVAAEVGIRPRDSKPNGDAFDAGRPSQREACFALGKILFELFSRGDPLPPNGTVPIDEDNGDSFVDLLLDGFDLSIDDGTHPPPPKRSSPSTADAGASASSSAKNRNAGAFLRERGLPQSVCQLVSDLLEAEGGNPHRSDTALLSLEDARYDLVQMGTHPRRFLRDLRCPRAAL